ncbi:GntR family transcriptional regulator [Kiritimatiellota bacterium B12222]|nr:GntR family transcriptional regulator [Kiritimatiellota bacterium B12222]
MNSRQKVLTKQQAAYRKIRSGIMSGALPPSTRLVIDKIAAELEVSAIPVREALSQLEKEGLVEIRPHAGAIVTDIPESAVEEIFALLEVLETVSCRLGIKKLSHSALNTLTGLAIQMEATDDEEKWLTLNRSFHQSLPRLAGLPRIEEQMIRVGENWERLRRLRFADRQGEDLDRANQQHRAFLKALEEKDVETAEKLTQQHNREALGLYISE